MDDKQLIKIDIKQQRMNCFEKGTVVKTYTISSAKNGLGECQGSECTPRGWHQVFRVIGQACPVNSVFVAREWTGEIYDDVLARKFPERDWILSRIIQIDGLEEGLNKGGDVDSLSRYIYVHGTPDTEPMGIPKSHGCIRMRNQDVMELADWVTLSTQVFIG